MKAMRRHDLLWTAGIAAITALFLIAVTKPQFGRARELKQSLHEEHGMASTGRSDLQELPRMQAEVNALREQVRDFEERVPARDELGAYLEQLARVAQEHQLRPDAIEPSPPVRSRDLLAVPIVLKVHGPFREVYGLLKDILSLPRLTQVRRFDAKVLADRPGEVQAEMQLRVFYCSS
jgi:Tfp pilus assembly protein PilO